ncbi:hypothetical protein DPMN_184262 [Dreissena polymorpha]|uniref:Uncharacterized protein n=1 Tax=Dreissena polymorpha TaxID=45954 RepID=A0A9D4DKI8_DREPO|nr:hypothetical protein DPMN_184262 [Dreissena polymorpha]
MTAQPQDVCNITPSEVAVTVHDGNTHVQFISVTQSQLVPGREFQFQDGLGCFGIAHNQGNLFITFNDSLYKYSMSEKLVCKLYKDIGHKGKNNGGVIFVF